MGLHKIQKLCVLLLVAAVSQSSFAWSDSESAPFTVSASRQFTIAMVQITIPAGHVLYRDSLQFFVERRLPIRVYPKLPAAVIRYDSPQSSGIPVYLTRAAFDVPLGAEPGLLRVIVKGQGCNVVDQICYSPFQRTFFLRGS